MLLVALLLTANCGRLQAATLDSAVGDTVDRICLYLKSKGESQISIGQFMGPKNGFATSGPGIADMFLQHFRRQNISVVPRANVGLKGEYALDQMRGDAVGVKITGSLTDPEGDVLTDFTFSADGGNSHTIEKTINHQEDVVQLLGVTTDLYPEDADQDRNRDLKKRILHPELHIDGTRCSASKRSPYRIEILINGRPAPIDVTDGLGFVKINRGDIYSVRIYNESDYDAAVRFSIDGLNVFAFTDLREPDGTPLYSFYIVPKGKVVELKGWHKNNETVNSFRVTSYADSAAATIHHNSNIGTITAVFSAAWPKGGKKPDDEDFTAKGEPNATGFGPPLTQVVQEVQREIGRLRSSISLRYSK